MIIRLHCIRQCDASVDNQTTSDPSHPHSWGPTHEYRAPKPTSTAGKVLIALLQVVTLFHAPGNKCKPSTGVATGKRPLAWGHT